MGHALSAMNTSIPHFHSSHNYLSKLIPPQQKKWLSKEQSSKRPTPSGGGGGLNADPRDTIEYVVIVSRVGYWCSAKGFYIRQAFITAAQSFSPIKEPSLSVKSPSCWLSFHLNLEVSVHPKALEQFHE